MRIYLVVLDDTPEAEVALRFAARRAAKTGGGLRILTMIEPVEFVAFGGAQATIEAEARDAAERAMQAAQALATSEGVSAVADIREGDRVAAIRAIFADHRDIAALVLGAGVVNPGPLVMHFAGADAGTLPCPVMIVPGGMSADALERLS